MNRKPNIIYFLVDDMGYGDVSCLNSNGKIDTPNIDRFAKQGMTFTDAHSTSSVCSPSRYGILTGRYNWRTKLQEGIVEPYGQSLISNDCFTVAKLLKKNNYKTACIGKWHLGMGWDFEITENFLPIHDYDSTVTTKNPLPTQEQKQIWKEAFSKPVNGGPIKAGFDYYFGVDIPNWPPYCFIRNDRTLGIPEQWLDEKLLGNNQASLQGPSMESWNFEQLLPEFFSEADRYIAERSEKEEPFFLYLPMTSPHTPLAVNKEWIGSSGLQNLYADFVKETDDIFGQILQSLDRNKIADNTVVVFASDNGCASYIGVEQLEQQGHFPSAHFRGYKADIWDGGHRIPLIVRWPEVIKEGSKSDSLVSLADFMSTVANIMDEKLDEKQAPDSFSMLPIFKDPSKEIRSYLIQHSFYGKFAIRDKNMKLVLAAGSGGWTMPDKNAEENGLPLFQLYNIKDDPGETKNLFPEQSMIVKEMVNVLQEIVANGRSTPGKTICNDIPVDIFKFETDYGKRFIIDDV